MRYAKLYLSYAKCSLIGKLTYKANVLIGIVAFLFTQITALLTLYLLVSVVPSVDGYTIYDIGLLFGITNMAIGIDHLVSDRLWTVAYSEVANGKMDHLFLRPVPVLFQVFASEIQLEAFGELITATALIIFCGSRVSVDITFMGVLLIVVGIICASIIITSFKMMGAALAFLFYKAGPILQFVYNFSTYSKYPLSIFPKFIRIILLFIIPLGVCIYLPFDNLFNSNFNPFVLLILMLFSTGLFLTVAILIWNICCKRYESTGT